MGSHPISARDLDTREGPYTTRSNGLCMREKPCPIAARMVIGPIRRWPTGNGYSRATWCIRCPAKGDISVNLDIAKAMDNSHHHGILIPSRSGKS